MGDCGAPLVGFLNLPSSSFGMPARWPRPIKVQGRTGIHCQTDTILSRPPDRASDRGTPRPRHVPARFGGILWAAYSGKRGLTSAGATPGAEIATPRELLE